MEKIPEGYMKNSRGGLDPVELVKDIDKKRNDLVMGIVASATEASRNLAEMKRKFMADIDAFVSLSERKYGIKKGGHKGNMEISGCIFQTKEAAKQEAERLNKE